MPQLNLRSHRQKMRSQCAPSRRPLRGTGGNHFLISAPRQGGAITRALVERHKAGRVAGPLQASQRSTQRGIRTRRGAHAHAHLHPSLREGPAGHQHPALSTAVPATLLAASAFVIDRQHITAGRAQALPGRPPCQVCTIPITTNSNMHR